MYTRISLYLSLSLSLFLGAAVALEGTKSPKMGVVSSNWSDRILLSTSLHDRALTLTDVQTPFLGTP